MQTQGSINIDCPVCGGAPLGLAATKFGVDYYPCANCGAVFCEHLDPAVVETQNDNPEARADVSAQSTRLARITQHFGRRPHNILDFGCGRGEYVAFLNERGFEAVGVDQHTRLKLSDIAARSIDVVNMVEVIEHLEDPNGVLQHLVQTLGSGGLIYIESSFADFIGDPQASGYVDPRIGHCCIHSRRSIDRLSKKFGLRSTWINDNVVVLHVL